MKKNKGYTMLELMIVVAMLAIFLTLSLVSFGPAREYSQKNIINTDERIILNAIDSWVADNSNPIQRPASFFAQNAQGQEVYKYISGNDIYQDSNLSLDSDGKLVVGPKENNKAYITFENGTLNTVFVGTDGKDSIEKNFFVFENKFNKDNLKTVAEYKETNQLIDGDYKELDMKNKGGENEKNI